MKNVNGFQVPNVHLTEAPKYYGTILLPDFTTDTLYGQIGWEHLELFKYKLIELGLVYPNTIEGKRAAHLHTLALMGIGRPWTSDLKEPPPRPELLSL